MNTIVLRRDDDGSVRVLEAPQLAEIRAELLGDQKFCPMELDDAGHLVIAGQVAYRPVRFSDRGTRVICERVA
jgi:hypothetical protein